MFLFWFQKQNNRDSWCLKTNQQKLITTNQAVSTFLNCVNKTCFRDTSREKLDPWCVLNRFLAKIDGFQWFRIDSSNFRNYQILKLWEFVRENLRRRIALYKWYLVAASGTPLKFILCIGRNALMYIFFPLLNLYVDVVLGVIHKSRGQPIKNLPIYYGPWSPT